MLKLKRKEKTMLFPLKRVFEKHFYPKKTIDVNYSLWYWNGEGNMEYYESIQQNILYKVDVDMVNLEDVDVGVNEVKYLNIIEFATK